MPILKNGQLVEDDAPNAIRWEDWQKNQQQNEKACLVFPNDQDPSLLEKELDKIAMIILEFPTFRDGRAYSQARMLREQMGFKGELRASGDVLVDQAFFMLRCGFDTLVLPQNADLTLWKKALQDFSLTYQPTDGQPTIWELRQRR